MVVQGAGERVLASRLVGCPRRVPLHKEPHRGDEADVRPALPRHAGQGCARMGPRGVPEDNEGGDATLQQVGEVLLPALPALTGTMDRVALPVVDHGWRPGFVGPEAADHGECLCSIPFVLGRLGLTTQLLDILPLVLPCGPPYPCSQCPKRGV